MKKISLNHPGENGSRRLFRRLGVKGVATVLFRKLRLIEVGKPLLVEVGPLINISRGGLAFQYVASPETKLGSGELAISVPEEGTVLGPVPFSVANDRVVAVLPDGKEIHTQGIRFEKLSPSQLFRLETFLKRYTRTDDG